MHICNEERMMKKDIDVFVVKCWNEINEFAVKYWNKIDEFAEK